MSPAKDLAFIMPQIWTLKLLYISDTCIASMARRSDFDVGM